MIEFEWRHNYTYEYHITWDINKEPYQILYLHYRNVSPILHVGTDKAISLYDKRETGVIPIHPSKGYHFEEIPKKLPYAAYIFELKETSDPDGDCLQDYRYELCNAPNIEVIKEEVPYKGDFSKLLIKSLYRIPGMLMELCLPIMPNESFSIPEMKRSSDSIYVASCLIKSGGSKNIKVRFNEKIKRFIHTTEV